MNSASKVKITTKKVYFFIPTFFIRLNIFLKLKADIKRLSWAIWARDITNNMLMAMVKIADIRYAPGLFNQ